MTFENRAVFGKFIGLFKESRGAMLLMAVASLNPLLVHKAHASDTNAIVTSAEATEEEAEQLGDQHARYSSPPSPGSESGSSAIGVSRAGLFTDILGNNPPPLHIADHSFVLGPSFNNFSTDAPTKKEPYSGVGIRHELRTQYDLSNQVSIGPSFELQQNFYSSSQGSFDFMDPSVRLVINDVSRARWGRADYRSSLWFQVYAPLATIDHQTHEYTELSISYTPMINFQGSRFFLTGVISLQTLIEQTMMQTGTVFPTKVVAASQINYRIQRSITLFAMDHIDFRAGPQSNLPTDAEVPDNYRKKANQKIHNASVLDGIMLGTQFQITRDVALSPRIDWQVDQNINSTTLGLNASIHFI
jgi:hypothetical protein